MIAVDTNILVYAHRRESRAHETALAVLRSLAEGNDVWGDSVAVLLRVFECRHEPPNLEWRRHQHGAGVAPTPRVDRFTVQSLNR